MNYAYVLDMAQVPSGFAQRNPRYFTEPYADAENVIVLEGFPEVEKAYPGCEVIGADEVPPSTDELSADEVPPSTEDLSADEVPPSTDELSADIAKMPKADLIVALKGYGVEVGDQKVPELRAMLTDRLGLDAE